MKHEQQQQAQRLYFQTDLSKTQIAETLNISRRNLHYWVKDNHWDRIKMSAAAMPSFIAENCYYIMAHYTEQLLSADRADKLLTREEVDNLHKLSITINKVKRKSTLNESMEMFTGFLESVHEKSQRLAHEIQPFVNEYITSQASISPKSAMPEKFNSAGYMPTPQPEQDPIEAQLDLEDELAWAQQSKSNTNSNTEAPKSTAATEPQNAQSQPQKPTDTKAVSPHSTSPSPSERACPDPLSGAGERSHAPLPPPYVTSPSPSERAGVRPSIREQLRGTASSGPGKSFYQKRAHAAV